MYCIAFTKNCKPCNSKRCIGEYCKMHSKMNYSDCPICYEPMYNKEKLDCNHEICKLCHMKWFDGHRTCPLCRETLPSSMGTIQQYNLMKLKCIFLINEYNGEQNKELKLNILDSLFEYINTQFHVLRCIDEENVSAFLFMCTLKLEELESQGYINSKKYLKQLQSLECRLGL